MMCTLLSKPIHSKQNFWHMTKWKVDGMQRDQFTSKNTFGMIWLIKASIGDKIGVNSIR